MPHVSPVDEEEVVARFLTGCLRLAHKARDVAERRLHLYRQQLLGVLPSIDIGNTLAQAGRLEVLQFCPIMMEDEVDVRIDQHDTLKGLEDIAEFGGVGLEELTPSRDIIEQIVHLETAAQGSGCWFLSHHLRGCYLQTRANLILSHTGQEFHLSDSSNRGEGLPTESHRMEGEEVVSLADLRCRMALESQTGVRLRHALSVVDDLDRGAPCVDNDHTDGLRTSIDSILHEFLDHRGWSLDHLTSRNLVGNAVGKELYDVAHSGKVVGMVGFGASLRFCIFSSVPSFFGRQLKMSSLEMGRT